MKRLIILITLVIIMIFSGCNFFSSSKRVTLDNVASVMEKTLEDKYGEDFSVTDAANRTSNGPFNSNPGYKAVATATATGETFNVQYGKKDGLVIDDYAGVLYEDKILSSTKEILGTHTSFSIDTIGIYAPLTSECWKDENQYEDYLQISGVYVWAWLTLEPLPDMVEEIVALCNEMENSGTFFSFTVTIKDGSKSVVVSHEPGEDMPTEDTIRSYFS